MVEVEITLDFLVLINKIASLKFCLISEVVRRGSGKSPLEHPHKTPPTWLLPPRIATSDSCSARFHHAETMVKGTEMGYCNFLPAKIGHWQLLQQANTDRACQPCVMPFHS
jgi:hypothetical protein